MIWYYISRSTIITFLIICFWLIANMFVNIPPDFHKYEGDIIHKEIVKADTIRRNNGEVKKYEYIYNLTYITKSGHAATVNNYNCKSTDYNYAKITNENKFYTINGWNVTIFIMLLIVSFFGTLLTICGDGIDDIDQMIYGNQSDMIKARDMRFKHYKILSDLWGYKDEETKELTYKAINLVKNNENYKYKLEHGHNIRVPNLTAIDEAVEKTIKQLIQEKQIKNG